MQNLYVEHPTKAQTIALLRAATAKGFSAVGPVPKYNEGIFFVMDMSVMSGLNNTKDSSIKKGASVSVEQMLNTLDEMPASNPLGMLGALLAALEGRSSEQLNDKSLHEPNVEIGFEDYDGNRGIYSLCVPCAIKALHGDDKALNVIFSDDRTKRMMLAYLLRGEGFSTSQDEPLEIGRAIHEQVEREAK